MNKTFSLMLAIILIASAILLAACGGAPAAAPTQAPTQAPAAVEPTKAPAAEPTAVPAAAGPADIKGMKACYLIPALSNTFLNTLANSVKAKAAADGVEVFVYGADDGGATQQFSQIENCISQGIKGMIVMAPGSIENVLPAVEEAQKKGIKVIGVPPGELEPFDAIMHTDQLEDGTKMAEMACNFINKAYPDAPDKGVEVAIIGNESGDLQMKLRAQGMRTIGEKCAKANMVQFVDISTEGMQIGASTAENILTAHPNVKVILASSSAHAQGVSQTIKALPNVDIAKYAVFAGDMDPTMIETVKSCQDPYKGLVAIGGTNLDQVTYDLLKKVLQGVEYPKITNDVLEPIFCESAPAAASPAASPADIKGMKACYLIPALSNTFLNTLANSVKAKAAADGVEVLVFGADDGGATQQFSQIENCISMGIKGMIVMAPGSIENVLPAVEEAQKKGIKVIGVPPGELEPFDAIMHTDQLEDGTKMAEMACNFINKAYPDAPDKGVEVAIIGNESGDLQMKLRAQGMRTIGEKCREG